MTVTCKDILNRKVNFSVAQLKLKGDSVSARKEDDEVILSDLRS